MSTESCQPVLKLNELDFHEVVFPGTKLTIIASQYLEKYSNNARGVTGVQVRAEIKAG